MARARLATAAAAALPLLGCGGAQAHHAPQLDILSGEVFSGSSSGRSGRIFHFSKDDTAIRVELAFAIPFLSIPVGGKKPQGALVDVNVGALAASGVFTVAAMMFIPHLFEGLSPMVGFGRNGEKRNGFNAILAKMDSLLKDQNVDASVCAQRAVCYFVSSSFNNLQRGMPRSVDKIIDGVVSNEWLSNAVKDSPFQDAINKGRYGGNCSDLYRSCPVSQKGLTNFVTNLTKMIKS